MKNEEWSKAVRTNVRFRKLETANRFFLLLGFAFGVRSHWLSLRSPNDVSSFFILHFSFKN